MSSSDGRIKRYFENAIERHWDPFAIDLDADLEAVGELSEAGFTQLRSTLALFGAGEEAVTEDLMPLGAVLEEPVDQQFVSSQLYDEARHAAFFDRYWETVIWPAEDERGLERSSPQEDRWFPDTYLELLDRTETAMNRLLEADMPANRARAYCHYHLTVEGILAQTGYYGVQTNFSDSVPEIPTIPGLVEGFGYVRSDEGRHVGFGMAKLKDLLQTDEVEAQLLHDTVNELVPLTQGTVSTTGPERSAGITAAELAAYAAEKHIERMGQITDEDALPTVDELVELETRPV